MWFPGCKNVLVLDSSMKNRRDVCFTKDTGSIHYPGLPGHIKTGCVASPSFKSRFCRKHDVGCLPTSPTELKVFSWLSRCCVSSGGAPTPAGTSSHREHFNITLTLL